jgi:hypothetical protein
LAKAKQKQKTKSAPSMTGRFFIGNSDKQAVLHLNEIGAP